MKFCMSHCIYKSILDAKFEADSSFSFRDITSQNFPQKKGNSSNSDFFYPLKTGLILENNEFLRLLNPKLSPHVNSSNFQAEETFSFSKFSGLLDEKRAAAAPLIDEFCQNLVRTCFKDKN